MVRVMLSAQDVRLGGDRVLSLELRGGAANVPAGGTILEETLTVEVALPLTEAQRVFSQECAAAVEGEALGRFAVTRVESGSLRGTSRITAVRGDLPDDEARTWPGGSLREVYAAVCAMLGLTPRDPLPADFAVPAATGSARAMLGHIGAAAGVQFRFDAPDAVTALPLIGGAVTEVPPSLCTFIHNGGRAYGPVAEVALAEDGAPDTWVLADEPFVTPQTLPAVRARYRGLLCAEGDFVWRGSPGLRAGDAVRVTDEAGVCMTGVVCENTLTVDADGLQLRTVLCAPAAKARVRVLTPEGRLNAAALSGRVAGSLIAKGSIGAAALDPAQTAQVLAAHLNTLDAEAQQTDALVAAMRRCLGLS